MLKKSLERKLSKEELMNIDGGLRIADNPAIFLFYIITHRTYQEYKPSN